MSDQVSETIPKKPHKCPVCRIPIQSYRVYHCQICGDRLRMIRYMGVQPDGWACTRCAEYYPADQSGKPYKKPIAKVF